MYGLEVPAAIRSMTIACVRTSIRSPWQNGVAERWVGSCRRDLLDHVIALNDRHLKRLLADYVRYYHEDRTHMSLQSKHPAAEFVQQLGVALFLARGSGACTTATIRPRKTISSKNDLRGSPILKVASLRRSHPQQWRNALTAKLASIRATSDLRTYPFLGETWIVAGEAQRESRNNHSGYHVVGNKTRGGCHASGTSAEDCAGVGGSCSFGWRLSLWSASNPLPIFTVHPLLRRISRSRNKCKWEIDLNLELNIVIVSRLSETTASFAGASHLQHAAAAVLFLAAGYRCRPELPRQSFGYLNPGH